MGWWGLFYCSTWNEVKNLFLRIMKLRIVQARSVLCLLNGASCVLFICHSVVLSWLSQRQLVVYFLYILEFQFYFACSLPRHHALTAKKNVFCFAREIKRICDTWRNEVYDDWKAFQLQTVLWIYDQIIMLTIGKLSSAFCRRCVAMKRRAIIELRLTDF